MDKIKKALNKLNFKERQILKKTLLRINKGDFRNLDTKKLKGNNKGFRVRKNNMRIIFYRIDDSIKILSIERRTGKTYKKR